MKKNIFSLLLTLLFFFMLFRPEETFHGASEGLLLWFQIILPTLFPFIIITNLLIATDTLYDISRLASPVISPIFQTSPAGTFAVIAGFLCGYPMGAKVTGDLFRDGKISRNEAMYLLSFCNNTSPVFIMNYVVLKTLKNKELLLPSLCILFLAPFLTSFFFRRIYKMKTYKKQTDIPNTIPRIRFHFDLIDHTIMNGFETITKVGGYIILFSVLIALLKDLPIVSPLWNLIFLPSLEITNGIMMLASSGAAFPIIFPFTMALISFGGICSIAQTQCMIQGTRLPLLPYIAEKLITAIVTSLLTIFYLHFIYI